MGTAKQSLEMAEGIRLGGIALLQALHSELHSVVVVVREGDSLDWLPEEARMHMLLGRCRLRYVRMLKAAWHIHCARVFRWRKRWSADGVLVMLADQPFIDGQMLVRLTNTFNKEAGYDYIASGDKGMPKPPVILGRGMWPAVAALEGDAGARSLFHLPATVVKSWKRKTS